MPALLRLFGPRKLVIGAGLITAFSVGLAAFLRTYHLFAICFGFLQGAPSIKTALIPLLTCSVLEVLVKLPQKE